MRGCDCLGLKAQNILQILKTCFITWWQLVSHVYPVYFILHASFKSKKNSQTRPKRNRHKGYKVNESDLPGLGPGRSYLRDTCKAASDLLVCFSV